MDKQQPGRWVRQDRVHLKELCAPHMLPEPVDVLGQDVVRTLSLHKALPSDPVFTNKSPPEELLVVVVDRRKPGPRRAQKACKPRNTSEGSSKCQDPMKYLSFSAMF